MASDLLGKWLGVWNPLTRGRFGNARANGLALARGRFWVRVAGGYNLYRWMGEKFPVQADRIVGAAGADATSISNFPHVGHEPSTRYWYLLRAVGAGGVEEQNCRQLVRAEFDASGALLEARPNAPGALRARPMAGGLVEVRWRYLGQGQEVEPALFEVFSDGGSGVMDWDEPVASVPHRRGKLDYAWTGGPYAEGQRLQLGVRARSEDGVAEDNEDVVEAWPSVTGPEPIRVLLAEPSAERR